MAESKFMSNFHFHFYTTSNILCPLTSMVVYRIHQKNLTVPITLAFFNIKNCQVNTYPAPKSLKYKSIELKTTSL